jgi:hypothetical protein
MDVTASLPISIEPLGRINRYETFLARSVNGTLFHNLRYLRCHAEGQIALGADAPVTCNGDMGHHYAMGVPTRCGIMGSHLEQTLQLAMHPPLEPAQQDRVLPARDAALQGG